MAIWSGKTSGFVIPAAGYRHSCLVCRSDGPFRVGPQGFSSRKGQHRQEKGSRQDQSGRRENGLL